MLRAVLQAAVVTIAVAGGADRGERNPSSAPTGTDRGAVADLSPAQVVGQRIVVGFDGGRPSNALEDRIRRGRVAGVILFGDNIGGRGAAERLIDRLQSIDRPRGLRNPLLIMLDQEGGLVKRLPGPPRHSAEEMGRSGRGSCRREGAATGRSLERVGVNVNLAPVLDVARRGSAIEEERRSFGRDPRSVSRCANAFAAAMERRGVAATAKHFPGLGAAEANTDTAVQEIELSRRKLRRVDERPYRRFIGAGARASLVMMSSAIYPSFSGRPAAFSRELATRELRRRLGFAGVSITDALDTVSAQAFGGPERVAREAAAAGSDLLLFTDLSDAGKASDSLRKALRKEKIDQHRFLASVERVLDLRAELGERR
jgi:beta-N-acetylhexosaminidase